jgi:hypothetical protein
MSINEGPQASALTPAIVETSAIEQISSGEVGQQLAAARANPRNLELFRRNAAAWSCTDGETAASCFYAVPRAGKTIEGPSIRMAEILAIAWGNLRVRTRLVGRDDMSVTVEAEVWDLETNAAFSAQETGRTIDKYDRPYSEDLVQVTIKATAAKARRNAILAVIPGAFVKPILAQCRKTAVGDVAALADTRAKALEALGKMGVTPDRILARLAKSDPSQIDLDDILFLRSAFADIRDGEKNVDEEFPAVEQPQRSVPDDFIGRQADTAFQMAADAQTIPPQQEPQQSAQAATPPREALVKHWAALTMQHPQIVKAALGEAGDTPVNNIDDATLLSYIQTVQAFADGAQSNPNSNPNPEA